MKILRFPDANNETSSHSNDAISAESSTADQTSPQGDKAPQSLNDYLIEKELIKDPEAKELADPKDQGSEIQKMNETAEAEKVAAEKQKNDEKAVKEKEDLNQEDKSKEKETKTEEEKKVEEQLNKNPRFQEVIAERNEVREQVKQLEPKAKWCEEVTSYLHQNGVTTEQYKAGVDFMVLCNVDPEAALKSIKPLVDKLETFTGSKLPADLQDKVDAGKIELSDAKEIATLRSRSEFGNKKLEHERKTYEQQQQENQARELGRAINSWQTAKMGTDPDYKPGSEKFQEVSDKYVAMLHRTDAQGNYVNQVKTSADLVALLEKAYVAVNGSISRLSGPKPPTRKNLSSNGSSSNNGSVNKDPAKAKTMQEAMTLGLEQSLARR